MTKSMYDCAWLPNPPPQGYDVAAGYVYGRGASHIWTAGDWLRAESASRYLLPVATCWPPFGDGAADAGAAVLAWHTSVPSATPCAFALDVEAKIAPQAGSYVTRWRNEMRRRGYYDIVYTSRSTAGYVGTPSWIAFGSLGNGCVIVQTGQEMNGLIDTDVADNAVPFFDTRPGPVPPPPGVPKMFVDMAVLPDNSGYWLVKADGAVFSFGNAVYHGGANAKPLNAPVMSIEATPSGKGYYLAAEDGGVFAYGDAVFHGSGVGK